MMMMGISTSDFVITSLGPASGSFTNGIEISVQVPAGFTNEVEIYSFTPEWEPFVGTNSVWLPLATNLQVSASSNVVWTNTSPGDVAYRFYAAGSSYDEDGDGLSGAMEIFTYNTDPTELDSDGDGYVDGPNGVVTTDEYPEGTADTNGYIIGELTLRTDPTNDDVSPPTVTITWPTNNYEAVFIP